MLVREYFIALMVVITCSFAKIEAEEGKPVGLYEHGDWSFHAELVQTRMSDKTVVKELNTHGFSMRSDHTGTHKIQIGPWIVKAMVLGGDQADHLKDQSRPRIVRMRNMEKKGSVRDPIFANEGLMGEVGLSLPR